MTLGWHCLVCRDREDNFHVYLAYPSAVGFCCCCVCPHQNRLIGFEYHELTGSCLPIPALCTKYLLAQYDHTVHYCIYLKKAIAETLYTFLLFDSKKLGNHFAVQWPFRSSKTASLYCNKQTRHYLLLSIFSCPHCVCVCVFDGSVTILAIIMQSLHSF